MASSINDILNKMKHNRMQMIEKDNLRSSEINRINESIRNRDLLNRSLYSSGRLIPAISGPVIVFTLSSGSVNGDYYYWGVRDHLSIEMSIWGRIGGDPNIDFLAYDSKDNGYGFLVDGGIEMYISLTTNFVAGPIHPAEANPLEFTDWVAIGGLDPTPILS